MRHKRLRVLAVLAWFAAPLALAAVALHGAETLADLDDRPDVWMPLDQAPATQDDPGGVILQWERSSALLVPANASGFVERVSVGPGDELRTGTEVVVVDQVARIAAVTAQPFSRALGIDDRGPDVEALNQLLGTFDLDAAIGDRFTTFTERGVGALAERLGVGGGVERFDPSWIIFLPDEGVTVDSVTLQPGTLLPGVGDAIVELKPRLVAAQVISADQLAVITANASSNDGQSDSEEVEFVASTVSAGQEVVIADTAIGATESNGMLSADSLGTLVGHVQSSSSTANVLIRQGLPDGAFRVASAALITGADGHCLAVRKDAGSQPVVVPVDVHDSALGGAVITAHEADLLGAEALVAPAGNITRQCP